MVRRVPYFCNGQLSDLDKRRLQPYRNIVIRDDPEKKGRLLALVPERNSAGIEALK